MASPTCVACGRPFPANGTLAALPDGRRIAFDPEHGRVWRICTHCREWNLLGQEAAARALPEVIAQHAGSAGPGRQGVSIARAGTNLEILRLGDQASLVADALAVSERHGELRRAGNVAAMVFGGLVLLLIGFFVAGWAPSTWLLPQMVAWQASLRLAGTLRRRRLALADRGRTLLRPALVIVAAEVVATLLTESVRPGWMVFLGWTALAMPYGVVTEWITHQLTRVRLPSGRRIRAGQESLRAMRIASSGDTLIVTPHDEPPLDARDSAHVLTHLIEWVAGIPTEDLDTARALVATTSSPAELLELVPSDDFTGHGAVRLDDLPLPWWAALDFAVTRSQRSPDAVDAARTAREVAEIAESLDRDEGDTGELPSTA
ncbi:MAG TPA: hypothetical protein PLI93_11710 [Gemmatimonadales bacterium]|nr:hypothetical protein [Gemmatimonadales bacterium]